MVLPYDFLDSMAWTVVASAALIGFAALRLRYKASADTIEENGSKSMRKGFTAAIGACGLYLFITGMAISFMWPFGSPYGAQYAAPYAGGYNNVLFGGVATLGGLVLLATAAALYFNAGLSVVSYFAAVAGLYAAVDAYAILSLWVTRQPVVSALGYLSFTAAGFLSIPATHTDNIWLRRLFMIFAFLFALAWLVQAITFTLGHLGVIA
jgi:putative membrane protein